MAETKPIILHAMAEDQNNRGLVLGNAFFVVLLVVAIPINTSACRTYFNLWVKSAFEVDREHDNL